MSSDPLPIMVIPRQQLLDVCRLAEDLAHLASGAEPRADAVCWANAELTRALGLLAEGILPAGTHIRRATDEVSLALAELQEAGPSGNRPALAEALRQAGARLLAAASAVPPAPMLEAIREHGGGHIGPGPWSSPAGDEASAAQGPVIWFLGEQQYQIGGGVPVAVSPTEDFVLQSFLQGRGLDKRMLAEASGVADAARVLRGLRSKYGGIMRPAIRCPGKKAAGGYFVRVRRMPQ